MTTIQTGLALLGLLVAGASQSGEEPADRVVLRSGKTVEGHVVHDGAREVVVRRGTRETSYDRKDVQSVDSVAANLRELLTRLRRIGPDDGTQPLTMLADWAAVKRLPGESRLLHYRVLELEPDNRMAHVALGHRERDGEWLWPLEKKWLSRDEIFEKRMDWKGAWELATTHYRIRSNAELSQVVAMAFDLERFYNGFYKAFEELELHEPWETLNVRLHAESRSYPELGNDRPSYFMPNENTLYVNLATRFWTRSMYHEATHQLLYSTAEHGPRAKGEIPAWLGEGLAEFMAESVQSENGAIFLDFGRPAFHHFREHVASTKPYRLNRVLQFGYGDFLASSHSHLKYAQCYTLVDFAMQGDGGEHRQGFLDFLRAAYRGRAGGKEFLRSLGLKERDCEERWRAHVEWMAQE